MNGGKEQHRTDEETAASFGFNLAHRLAMARSPHGYATALEDANMVQACDVCGLWEKCAGGIFNMLFVSLTNRKSAHSEALRPRMTMGKSKAKDASDAPV